MRSSRYYLSVIALFASLSPFASQATVFFSDTFTNGSTINSVSAANPTPTNTAYQMLSTKTQTPTPAITANDLVFGIASTGSGVMEVQALFATNPIPLVLPGDNIQLTIVFTNRSGILSPPSTSQLGIGLFYSGNTAPFNPLPGGTNASTLLTKSDYTQKWQGYVGQIVAGANRIMTRPSQVAAADGWNQELVLSGSSSSTYRSQTTVGSTTTSTVTLTTGATYTEVLSIVMNDVNSLAITNTLYSGAGTGGTAVVSSGGIATNTTFLTGGFNGFGFGYQAKATGPSNTIDVASVVVSGSVTPVTGPPTIDQQPVDVTVPNGGSCAFSVAATGYSVTYQWHRNGTNLLNGGNISGATSSQLVISPAGPGDNLSGANGYYVTVTGAGPYSTNSEIHSLTFTTPKNLVWSSGSSTWDLNTTPSWQDRNGNTGLYFNFGDAVAFDDVGGGGTVNLTGSYLSASSVTVSNSMFYTFAGTGSFAGSGKLIYNGSAQLTINNPNTYTGGTIISNSTAKLRLQNLSGLGTGPITFAQAGSQIEIITAGSSSTGINSDMIVADDCTIALDAQNTSYAMVLNGNLSGTAGKTLTIQPGSSGAGTSAARIRISGTNTVYNANLNLNDSTMVWSPSGASGSQTYNGIISGTGVLLQKSSTTYLINSNTYSGGTMPTGGSIGLGRDSSGPAGSPTDGPIGTGPLLLINDSTTSLAGSGTVFASGGARTVGNPIQYVTGSNNLTLIIGGTNNLTLSGPFTLQGNDGGGGGTNRTIQADNTAASILSGVISDGGLVCGLIKTGTNTLYLDGPNTYTGPTTVSAGRLAGAGSITSTVTVQTNAAISGGSAAGIGTLNITGNLIITNGGGGFFRVNRAGASSDKVSVSGNITSYGTGTITVTNLGAALQTGDKFNLFNGKAVTGGATLVVTGGGMIWSNGLAVDGSITVLPSAPPTIITQPTNRAVAQGSSVALSVTVSTVTGVTNYTWQFNSNSITAGNVTGTNTGTLTITNFQAANAGYYRVLVGDGNNTSTSSNADLTLAVAPTIGNSGVSGTTLTLQIPTQVGPSYLVQTNSNLTTTNWQTAATLIGDGTTKPFATSITSSPQLFIRVKMQ